MTTTSRRPPTRTQAKTQAKAAGTQAKAPKKRTPAAETTAAKSATTKPATTTTTGAGAGATSTATKTRPKAAPAKSTATAKKSTRPAASRRAAPPRAPFVLLIIGLLGGALVSLLLLNTVLAKDAFTLTRLQQSNKRLEQQRQAYEEEIAREGSPQQLAKKAEALNMKKGEDPAFFSPDTGRASGGKIRPVPHAAAASAGAAGVLGVPGTVVPGDGVPPPAAQGGAAQGGARQSGSGHGASGQGASGHGGPGQGAGARTGNGAP